MCIRDRADDVHEVAVGVEALREVRRGVGSALVHGVAGEVCDAGPDDAGVLDGLDGLLDAEQLGVLVDLALEAVSYTHLDVYKRQAPRSTRAPPPR